MRKLSKEHKEKLSQAKRRYYSSLNGEKRPYKRNIEGNKTPDINRIKSISLQFIEIFNDLNRENNGITEEVVDRYFKKEEEKNEYENKFF